MTKNRFLEGQFAVRIVDFGKAGAVIPIAVLVIAASVSARGGFSIVAAMIFAVVTTVRFLRFAEVNGVSDYFCAAALVAVLVFPVAYLKAALDNCHASLLEVLGDKLATLTPSDAVDEVGLTFAVFLVSEVAVNSKCERSDGGS